ncbi:uncharacterized protein LOC135322872 [Camelus dromedarius]|uniref:uncharacterized protein LOC135322872 n=1 Tax=Camelus dromedarius TaxID=9838 RepID=UPI00311A06F0
MINTPSHSEGRLATPSRFPVSCIFDTDRMSILILESVLKVLNMCRRGPGQEDAVPTWKTKCVTEVLRRRKGRLCWCVLTGCWWPGLKEGSLSAPVRARFPLDICPGVGILDHMPDNNPVMSTRGVLLRAESWNDGPKKVSTGSTIARKLRRVFSLEQPIPFDPDLPKGQELVRRRAAARGHQAAGTDQANARKQQDDKRWTVLQETQL